MVTASLKPGCQANARYQVAVTCAKTNGIVFNPEEGGDFPLFEVPVFQYLIDMKAYLRSRIKLVRILKP
jgi:hypothetical protein